MTELTSILKGRRQSLTRVLALTLDGSRLEGAVLRRTNGSLQPQQTVAATLSLDPLTASPELVGREIRNHLDAAGIRERFCVLGLPLKWVLTAHAEVPAIEDADVPGFLQIEAERGFPCDVSTLFVGTSQCRAGQDRYALLAAVPRTHLAALEAALRAANLKPVSFRLPIMSLEPPATDPRAGVLALVVGESSVRLAITCGGGVAALRTVEGALEQEGGRRLHADIVAREARITLGQLPAGLRDSVRRCTVYGPRELAQQLSDELELRLEPLGLKVEMVQRFAPDRFGLQLPPETPVSGAVSLAADHLSGRPGVFQFLPPRVSAWRQVINKYPSGKLRLVGAGAAVVVLAIVLMFLYQQWQLVRLETRWASMAPKIKQLDKVLQQTRQYRPWFDDSYRSLTVLKQLTLNFPEEGSVTARSIEVRDQQAVTCTGVAQSNNSLLRTLDRIRGLSQVTDLKLVQIRGKSPMQFTFDFRWNQEGASEH